jgi:hypothetical protein
MRLLEPGYLPTSECNEEKASNVRLPLGFRVGVSARKNDHAEKIIIHEDLEVWGYAGAVSLGPCE